MRGDPVKEKILELIQTWSHAFRNEAKYKAVEDCFHLLKMEGMWCTVVHLINRGLEVLI